MIMPSTVLALARFLSLRFLYSCGGATEFPQFGSHFDHGLVEFLRTVCEFLNFLLFSRFALGCGRRLNVRSRFLRLLLVGFLLLTVA